METAAKPAEKLRYGFLAGITRFRKIAVLLG